MGKTRICYLLHFKRPLAHARHYLGSTSNLEMRINAHNHGGGSRITQVAHDLGIEFELVRTWDRGGRKLERRLKNRHNGASLCPKCHGEYLTRRRRYYRAGKERTMSEYRLVRQDTGEEVKCGARLESDDGPWIVADFRPPKHAGSSGRVIVRHAEPGNAREFFPHDFGLEIVKVAEGDY